MKEKEEFVKWFFEINKSSVGLVGEKASYLCEAYNKKILSKKTSIPEGFVITKTGIDLYFKEKNIPNSIKNILEEVDYSNVAELEKAENQIKDLIMKSDIPEELREEIYSSYDDLGINEIEIGRGSAKDILSNAKESIFVAVRNSYIDESGDSYFNIKGNSNLINAIKKCLISLFTKERLLEEKEKGNDVSETRTAIIIQKMIQCEKSGILYSGDELKVLGIWGLGAGLKEEEIGKDEYTLRRDGRLINTEVNEKKYAITRDSSGSHKVVTLKEGYSFGQVFEEHELRELSDVLLRLEDIFQEKIQFEFGIEENQIYIFKIEKLKEINFTKKPKEEKVVIKTEEIKEETIEKNIKEEILPPESITQTKIELIIGSQKDSENSIQTTLKSAGLVSIEDIIKTRGIHPLAYLENFNTKGYEEVLVSGLTKETTNLDEAWIRLSDFTTKEFKDLDGAKEVNETNPLMGLCGIRFLLSEPELLKRELKAINEIKNSGKEIGVLIPKISSVYELKKVKEFLKNANIELKIGLILETPASIQLIKDFVEEGIDAVVFYSDMLSQYLLAIDKENPLTKEFYDDTSPALMYQIEYVIRVCKRNNIKTSFYGSSLKNKEMVEYLVKKEIDSILVKPEDVKLISSEIKKAEEKYIVGTDKEVRKYEIVKEKERQKKELAEFEKMKETQINEEVAIMSGHKTEELIPEVDKALEAIEAEKQEYLNENPTEINSELPELENEVDEDLGPNDTKEKSLDEVEKAMREIEEHNKQQKEKSSSSDIPEDVAKAIEAIESEKQEYLNETQASEEPTEEIKDPELEENFFDETEDKKSTISLENQDEKEELIEENVINEYNLEENFGEMPDVKIESELKENPNESFEQVPEEIENLREEIDEGKIEYNVELIEKEKEEYVKENPDEDEDYESEVLNELNDPNFEEEEEFTKKDDPLGIF